MSLLSGLDDFWLFVSHRSEDRRRTYNVASLPEQFEMLHDYHQLSSKDRLADQAVHQRTRGLRAEDERGKVWKTHVSQAYTWRTEPIAQ